MKVGGRDKEKKAALRFCAKIYRWSGHYKQMRNLLGILFCVQQKLKPKPRNKELARSNIVVAAPTRHSLISTYFP